MKTFIFVIAISLSISAFAQKCDPNFMFEKIVWPEPPFMLLKPYAIPVREIKGAPFSIQYSYLLEKGSVYAFYLKRVGKGTTPINFTLTDSENTVIKVDTLANYKEDGLVLSFMTSTSDAYNINLHSAESFDGCLIFYVSVHRLVTEQTKNGWKATLPSAKPIQKLVERDTLIKKFEIPFNTSSSFGLGLEKDQLYALRLIDGLAARLLSVNVDARNGSQPKTRIVPQLNGYTLFIKPQESGLHIFNFGNPSKNKPMVALLYLAQEPPK